MPLVGQSSLNDIEELIEALDPQLCGQRDTVTLVDHPRRCELHGQQVPGANGLRHEIGPT